MKKLFINISSLVTVAVHGAKYKSGIEMQDIGEIKDGVILFDDKIEWIGTSEEAKLFINFQQISPNEIYDLKGKTVLPGFVDSHTHIVFAGNRSDEFARRLRGATYQEIASEGGGILKTMNATRKATVEELVENGKKFAISAIKHGTTAIEIKSGYGLTNESEIKQLEAINILKKELPIHITSTFMGAHDFPPEYADNRDKYVDLICEEMIPLVAERKLAEYCDAFIDKDYYTLEQGAKILRKALDYGLKLKAHCDELADVGAAGLAAKLGAISADHLLFISDNSIEIMRKAGTVATLLPGTAYFIRMPYAPARKIIENNLPVALATDCNPGSCFTENMQTILSLAVINMKMTAEEAICAATINGAAAIEQSHIMGSIEKDKLSNFIIANVPSYTDLFYHFGINHFEEVWIKGEKFI